MDERDMKERDGRTPGADGGADGTAGRDPAAPDPRPRSRRGTRGGQRRRAAKPAGESAGTAPAPTAAEEAADGRASAADVVPRDAGETPPVDRAQGAAKRRRPPRKKSASAAGAPAAGVDAPAAAERVAQAPPAADTIAQPARRTRRRRKAPAEVTPAVDESAALGAATEVTASPAPKSRPRAQRSRGETGDAGPADVPESADTPQPGSDRGESQVGGEEAEESPKRRRRGARGGRRVRAREARRAAALTGADGGATADAGMAASAESPATDEPAGAPETTGEDARVPSAKRRGRRGGRRKGAATLEAGVAPPQGAAGLVEGADLAAGTTTPAAVAVDRVVGDAGATLVAASAEAEPGEPARKRSRRGGRRGKRAAAETATEGTTVADTEAAGKSAQTAAPDAAVKTAAPGKAAKTAARGRAGKAAAPADAAGPAVSEEDKDTKKGRRRDHRRPKAIVRPESLTGADAGAVAGPALTTGRRPEVSVDQPKRKLILVTEDPSELRVALVEDGRLAEIYFERPQKRSYLGDIYRGKVENVLAGIDAAFIDFGLDKNGFLYVDEVRTGEGDRRGRRIADVLKPGQDVVVQVMKDPMGSKGARLTMHLSLAGRYVVYVPGGSGVGVSRRLGQTERDRLRDLCKELRVKNAGLIVRTAAEGEGLEEIRRDVRVLSRQWSRLKKKAETAPIPGLVHKEVDIALEVTRDLFNESVESLIVDDEKRHKTIVGFLEKVAPELVSRVRLHSGAEPLFEAYGIEQQISRALERRVPLPSGGNIVIDHTEALTVIDVNSGRFTSGRGLEDTILKTNLEAAREVVRELRLRDIGGIIIIDFIDMSHVKNRETVLATLEAELDTDRTKTYVVELSPLGLVEMTRQNTTDGARGILTRACPSCQGKARTMSEETVALSVERRLRVQSRRSGAKACLVDINAGVAERLTAGGRLKALEKATGRRIFLEGSSSVAVDAFRILAEGSVDQVQGQRIPVREGQEVEVELEFALTYSPRDAVGYVDGYMVIVEGGRAFLGQRRKARITDTSRTGASAVLTGGRGGGGG